MEVYILLLLVLLINIFLETQFINIKISNYRIETRKLSFTICFLYILTIGIMRSESLGVDVDIYRNYFLNIYPNADIRFFLNNSNYDIAYVIFNKIVKLFTGNFRIFEIIIYCINFGIFSLIIFKESKCTALSFLIYTGLDFIGFNMSILRQSIACVLCFLAYHCLDNNKKINYFILVLLATLFHKTAILFLITYLLSYNRKEVISFKSKIILILLSFIGFNLILPNVYSLYRIDYSDITVTGQGLNLLIFYIISMLIVGIILKINKSEDEVKKYESSCGAIYIQMGALSFSLFTRITRYFAILFTLSIPNIIYKSKYRKAFILIYSLMFSFLFIYNLYRNEMNIVPFKLFI